MDFQTLKYKVKNLPLVGETYEALIGRRKVERIKQARKEALKHYGNDVLTAVQEVMDELQLDWFVDYGSLLGIIRDGRFIEYDDDMDFGVYLNSYQDWEKLEEAFAKRGMKKVRGIRYNGNMEEMTFGYHDLTFDFFRHWTEDGEDRAFCFWNRPGVDYPQPNMYSAVLLRCPDFGGTRIMDFGSTPVRVPQQAEQYLASVYTEGWRIPDPNWQAGMSPAWNDIDGSTAFIETY